MFQIIINLNDLIKRYIKPKTENLESEKKDTNVYLYDDNRNFFMLLYLYTIELFSDKLFLSLATIYILGNSTIVTMGSLINIICTNFGFASFYGSITALIVITLGLTSSVLYSIFFIKKKNQQLIQSIYITSSALTLLFAVISILSE